jgi:hypothetical protein
MGENKIAEKFADLLNEFKRPMLQQEGGSDSEQSLERIDEVLKSFDRLYFILSDAINANGNINSVANNADALERRSIWAVFEKEGIFPALRADPDMKEDLLRILKLHLKTYPYTLREVHIKQLAANKTPSSPEIPALD